MATKRTTRETAMMREAFDFYYALGDSRNLGKVAAEFRRTVRTVEMWSSSFLWPARVAERDRQVAEEMERKMLKDIVESKVQYRKFIKLALKRFLDALTEIDENGDPVMKVNTIAEFEKIVKLDLLLMGEPTERTKVQQETTIVPLTAEDRKALKDLQNAILRDIQAATNDEGSDESKVQ